MSLSNQFILKIKNILRPLYYAFYRCQDIIVFESLPDLSDNTKAVFDEMVARGMNKKYKLVWGITGNVDLLPKIDNVVYHNLNSPADAREFKKHSTHARCLICCNNFLLPYKSSQPCFYLSHGTTLKSLHNFYQIPDEITYFLVASPNVTDLQSYEFNVEKEKIFALGFPRNDALTGPKKNLKEYFDSDFNKIVVWYPTYRLHKYGLRTGSKQSLPIIHNAQYAKLLNEAAQKNGILLVLKPHFAQDVRYVKDLGLSNIRFIDDSFFTNNHLSSYEFVGSCDALITDYSSIYYDYTLCDKPIAAIWEDIDEYKRKPGLIENYEYFMSGAEKVYNIDDFISFIQRLGQNVDLLAEERRKIRDVVNYATDGKNTSRVVDFIAEKAHL